MARQRIKIVSPIKLYDEGWARGEQPEGTCPESLNVFAVNPANDRVEIAQRYGCNLATYFDFASGIMRPPTIIIDPGSGGSGITVIPIPPGTPVIITSAIVDDSNLPTDGSGGEIIVTPGSGTWSGGGGGGGGGGGSGLPGGGGGGGDPILIPKITRKWTFLFKAYYSCDLSEWVEVELIPPAYLAASDVGETPWEYSGFDDDINVIVYRKEITVVGGTATEAPPSPATPAYPVDKPPCGHVCEDPARPLKVELYERLPLTLTIIRDGSTFNMKRIDQGISYMQQGVPFEAAAMIQYDCALEKWTIMHWPYGFYLGPGFGEGPAGNYVFEAGGVTAVVS